MPTTPGKVLSQDILRRPGGVQRAEDDPAAKEALRKRWGEVSVTDKAKATERHFSDVAAKRDARYRTYLLYLETHSHKETCAHFEIGRRTLDRAVEWGLKPADAAVAAPPSSNAGTSTRS